MRTLTLLLLALILFSCNRPRIAQGKVIATEIISETNVAEDTVIDEITQLLDKALMTDTLELYNEFEFDDYRSFLFFKSGRIIGKTEKNALVVICPTETTYAVRLYGIQSNRWIILDSIGGLDAGPTQFDPILKDYNFDGQTDIYLQVSASNGWSLSRGHLITIDPETKNFELHNETRDFANMKPDLKTHSVATELWNGYDMKGRHQLTIITNKWVDGQLKTISKKDTILGK